MKRIRSTNRRRFLQGSAAAAGSAALLGASRRARAQSTATQVADKLLFVFTATGGANIADSFMAVRESEASASVRESLNVYPDAYISEYGSGPFALRALDLPVAWREFLPGASGNGFLQSTFLQRHGDDVAVMPLLSTSVNHLVGQGRAVTGAEANRGRTLGESMAERHGQSLSLPYLNMSKHGYLTGGQDPSLPAVAQAEAVTVPTLFPAATDGVRGLVGAPGSAFVEAPTLAGLDRARALLDRARGVRDSNEAASRFGKLFQCSPQLLQYQNARGRVPQIEASDAISELMVVRNSELDIGSLGLAQSSDVEFVRSTIESQTGARNVFNDDLLAQVALSYLAAKNGYSASLSLGLTLNPDPNLIAINPPGSFDFSHQNHVATQSVMWSRTLEAIDSLIRLLKNTPTDDGGTMWDRSLVYVATDFGRDKQRFQSGTPIDQLSSSGHHLNNATVMISPMLNGGRVYGAMDPDTLLATGCDRETGVPDGSNFREQDAYGVACQALDIDYPGRVDTNVMVADA